MTYITDDTKVSVNVEGIGGQNALSKAETSTQLPDRRVRSLNVGVKPPYNPDRLASFLELNETLATGIRKKARYEVGYGFSIVPHRDVDPDEASEDERTTVREFWRGIDSRWQTKARQAAEPTTPEEVLELARQDYHLIGWAAIEILTNLEGEPVGLAHVPANTVRVRKPQSRFDQPRHPEQGTFIPSEDARLASRGYVQIRDGRKRYFGEAGDRYRGRGEDDDREPIFVDRETGDVVEGSAEALPNAPANELIFVTNPSPLEDYYGVPDWVSAIRTIAGDEAAKDYNTDFFDNDTIPRLAIKVTGGELSEESKKDLRQMLDGLREESHRTVLLEVDKFETQIDEDVKIDLEPLGQGISEEMDFRLFREKNEHEIAKVLEVPPILIGVTETSNRSNSREQVREFATDVVAPEQHKFAERLYQILHQQAFGVRDWTLEFDLHGAEQPKEDATVARQKISAVRGAIPVNRALEMIGEDPLPEDHPIDGDTLVADIGSGAPAGEQQPEEGPADEPPGDVEEQLPPPENKLGERDWAEVEAVLAVENGVATKDPIEQTQFDSSNLAEGLFDFGENELYLSFHREGGQNSLYVYVDVPAAEWSGLVNASSHGSYHYDSIRLEFPYLEITNHHSRLPEGPAPDPDDVPDDIPL
ncbi:phage portal protein [Salinilacihabitans rarus]|uniref:phage portal protein n=1 Tax=Salinilacihabitans rarus TaxID=2961596 RepID=UPI0020C9363B|nr:phage portal protein [Salinilacihabitans rarus]